MLLLPTTTLALTPKSVTVQDKYEEAELLYGRAIVILEGTLGKDHVKVAVILSHQARVMAAQV